MSYYDVLARFAKNILVKLILMPRSCQLNGLKLTGAGFRFWNSYFFVSSVGFSSTNNTEIGLHRKCGGES